MVKATPKADVNKIFDISYYQNLSCNDLQFDAAILEKGYFHLSLDTYFNLYFQVM